MLRIAICDDELQELSHISQLLKSYQEQRRITFHFDTFSNAIELLETMRRNVYDILLLDVLMPGINGIQAAREIRENDSTIKLIFLSSSPDFAVDSYMVDAYYYLLKPATETKLFSTLDKLFLDLHRVQESIMFKVASGITRIPYNRLEFLEVIRKKLRFHLTDGSIKEAYGSLSEFEAVLLCREEFIKIHRSIIVNMGCIQELKPGGITTVSGQNLPVSRLLYTQVREIYMHHLFT